MLHHNWGGGEVAQGAGRGSKSMHNGGGARDSCNMGEGLKEHEQCGEGIG